MDQPNWIDSTTAATLIGVSRQNVGYLCRRGHLRCRRFARAWFIDLSSAEDWRDRTPGRGRPRIGRTK